MPSSNTLLFINPFRSSRDRRPGLRAPPSPAPNTWRPQAQKAAAPRVRQRRRLGRRHSRPNIRPGRLQREREQDEDKQVAVQVAGRRGRGE